jgi:alanyl-tRNA synthetase
MKPDAARALTDTVKAKYPDGVAILAVVFDGKLNFVAAAGKDAVAGGVHCGNILREVSAITGGKGGGRPDSAMSGGRDIDKIDAALARAVEIISAL